MMMEPSFTAVLSQQGYCEHYRVPQMPLCIPRIPASLTVMNTDTITEMHPWASTPEATEAALKAVQIPLALLPALANRAGADKLEAQALVILAECALPPRDQFPAECGQCGKSLDGVRKGARFCGPDCRKEYAANMPEASKPHPRGATGTTGPLVPAYVGSMYTWPEDDRQRCAMREIGYALNNWLRINHNAL